jgi:integrase
MAMFRINVKKRARILTRPEFKRMLKVATVTRDVERNQLLLCFSHACGLRCTELASITIRDIMQPSGVLKSELTLRAEITKNARVRTVPMPEGLLTKHIELYMAYRFENSIGVIPKKTEDFRGLSPDLPVIFSGRGSGFAMARKVRVLESGITETYSAADALEQLFRDLYHKGGMIGASSHSGKAQLRDSAC